MSKKPHKLEHGHIITFDDAGHRYIKGDDYVIGMTTILKYLAAPALENWKINQLTEAMQSQMKEHLSLDVIDKIIINAKATLNKKQEGVFSIGKVVHKLAEQWLKKDQLKLPEDPIVLNCFRKFQKFWKKNKLKVIESEKVLYSTKGFAGTLDIIAKDTKGNLWLIDIKTSVGFFINMIYQLHGYKLAYEEQTGKKINKMYIVRLPKTDDDFEAREFTFQKQHQNAFLGLLHCHKSQLLFNEQSRKFKQSRLLKQRSKTNGKLK
jgi:hypothetical protein